MQILEGAVCKPCLAHLRMYCVQTSPNGEKAGNFLIEADWLIIYQAILKLFYTNIIFSLRGKD